MANGGQNVNQAAANGMTIAGGTAAAGTGYQAPTLAGANLNAYQNPYQQQVIGNTVNEMDRARQMTQNMNGAQAGSVGAFGGSRHGLVEAETNRAFADQVGNYTAQMNQAGFNNAQNAAQFDINNDMAAQGMRLGAASQVGGLANQAFDMGQTLNTNLQRDGLLQQALQQQIIDAANSQYAGFTGAPQQALNLPLAALGATPNVSSTTQSSNPGMFNFLSMGLGLL